MDAENNVRGAEHARSESDAAGGSSATFVPVMLVADVPPGHVRRCEFRGVAVAVYNVDGAIYATQDDCTHGRASLSDGYLIGDEIECPLHQGMFNVRTGEATAAPCVAALRMFRTDVQGGIVRLAAALDRHSEDTADSQYFPSTAQPQKETP